MKKIEIKNLTKIFGKNTKEGLKRLKKGQTKEEIFKETGMTVGVNQVDLDINEGELFVIMGLSGSGKSTLIRMLNRLIEPTSGDILIDGVHITNLNKAELRDVRRQKIAMVFQSFALFPHMTIAENTAYGLEVQGIPEEDRLRKAKEALELVNLAGYEGQYPSQLSGGMQQRVGLARALAADTDIILMDEAFSALDPLIRKEMQDELEKLQAKMGKTIVFITHDLNEALKLGDHIALMRDGKIVQVGTPEEILMNPANTFVERFVEDVDVSKILSAENIMIQPETIDVRRHGPRVALERMKQAGISSIYVVNEKNELQGIVTADAAAQGIKDHIVDIRSIMETDIPRVDEDCPLTEIIEKIYDIKVPIAVTDQKVLKGIIIRGTVLAALSKEEVSYA